jgi:cobalt/nickel transport system ATP-binding protein
LIRLQDIEFYYDECMVLDGIDLDIQAGERIVLLGNNGCGKSTLLKLLAGLIYPKSGNFTYNGTNITKSYLKTNAKEFRKDVSILFQNPDTMLFNPTVKDEIAFGLDEFDMDADITQLAKEFEIEHLLDRNPLTLSGGEKQKVAFCAIFATNPKVLILDEPTANLDPKSTGWMIDFLSERDITTIISTHNLSLALELGSRAVVMDETHQIIYDGDIKELFTKQDILLQANLLHKHKHHHDGIVHSHLHIHDWS